MYRPDFGVRFKIQKANSVKCFGSVLVLKPNLFLAFYSLLYFVVIEVHLIQNKMFRKYKSNYKDPVEYYKENIDQYDFQYG